MCEEKKYVLEQRHRELVLSSSKHFNSDLHVRVITQEKNFEFPQKIYRFLWLLHLLLR